jgi:hypothetical protein
MKVEELTAKVALAEQLAVGEFLRSAEVVEEKQNYLMLRIPQASIPKAYNLKLKAPVILQERSQQK